MENKTPVRYQDEDHSYWIGDLRIPGINELLNYWGYIDNTYYSEVPRDRGTAVHAGISDLCNGGKDYMKFEDPEITERISSFMEFMAEKKFKPLQIEAIQYAPTANIACRVDLIGKFGDSTAQAIIEIKCGAKAKWHSLQTAAQALCSGIRPIRRFCLYLKPYGKYNLVEHSNPVEMALVHALGTLYWYNKNAGIKLTRGENQ